MAENWTIKKKPNSSVNEREILHDHDNLGCKNKKWTSARLWPFWERGKTLHIIVLKTAGWN